MMNRTFKNIKYKNKIKKTIKKNEIDRNLRGGKNFIDYLFNLDSEKSTCNNDNKDEKKDDIHLDNEDKKIKKQIVESENILEKWIQYTTPEEGVTLYFATEEINDNNSEKEINQNWISGFHGKALKHDYKFKFNDYIKDKLENSDNHDYKKCLDEINKNGNNECQNSLTEIQIDDIHKITERIEMNNKVNDYLFKWLEFNKTFIKNKEKEILDKVQEMKKELDEKKDEIEKHKKDIHNLINKNLNYNKIIKEYIGNNPDYGKLKETKKEIFEIEDNMIKYINFSLKDHKEGDLNTELNF